MPELASPQVVVRPSGHEARCRMCGRCCYLGVILAPSFNVAVTELPCRYLDLDDGHCRVYRQRHERAPWCCDVATGIQVHGYPDDCPYVAGKPEYQGRGKQFLPPLVYGYLRLQIKQACMAHGRPQMVDPDVWQQFVEL